MNMLQTLGGGGIAGGLNDSGGGNCEQKERLIATVKKEVKQLMEEAVTKKHVHEDSGSVTSLCGAVEACLSHGLRRRALGLFKTSSTTALIQKIARSCSEADYVSRRLLEVELSQESHTVGSKRSSSSSDSIIKPKLLIKGNSNSVTTINTASSGSATPVTSVKYLWIRIALFEKCLSKIIEYLVNNANNYYERDALVADTDYGSILSSLLVGPCALEFSRAKILDYYWSDPCADELVQRHRISSGNRTPPTCHRPIINFKRTLHTSSEDSSSNSYKASSPANVAKDYVESLHQNSKNILLYGKNNVLVLPKDLSEPIAGYLSLHQSVQTLTIKWTPNQLMNGYNDNENVDTSFYWTYALNINVDEIVYVHCHQNRGSDTGGTIILVGQDGVQRPPIHFPEGGHLQSFLSCLETGLLPHGQLDPPLWSQRGMSKLFPWPKNVRRRMLPSVMESTDESPIDYVFRVVSKSHHEEFLAMHPILELERSSPRRKHLSSCSTTGSSDCSSKSLSIDQSTTESPLTQASQTASIELVCSTMRRQIISRAFYGWLAYCRHLSTVRTHLSGLVNGRITPDSTDEEGLTKEKWHKMHVNGVITGEKELFRLVYFKGVSHEIRKQVWPYLLGHYSFGSTPEEREKHDLTCKHYYEMTMSEWLAVEAIVRQREKEKNAFAMAKMTAEQLSRSHGEDENSDFSSIEKNVCSDTNLGFDSLRATEFEKDNGKIDDNDYSDISDTGADNNIESCTEERTDCEMKNYDTEAIGSPSEITEKQTDAKGMEAVVLEFENIDDMETLHIQDNCFVAFENDVDADQRGNVLMLSVKSSPSTSSYETVGNELTDNAEYFMRSNDTKISSKHPKQLDHVKAAFCDGSEKDEDEDEESLPNSKFHSVDDVRTSAEHIPTAAVVITEAYPVDSFQSDMDAHQVNTASKNDDAAFTPSLDALQEPKSVCVSPASSNGGVYSVELLENFGLNLHRIEKDVQRCDRNYWYFANENLDKLRNVISTYVWEHLDIGYMQGMCDLVAPLLVILDDEALCYSCFCKLMERMIDNFPNGGAMDMHFANMRSLIQILDSEMYDLMGSNGDYTHFYFCYRWFLLDFKRELVYDDVFATWEVIWAAKHVASSHFVLFLALALLETYRDIILSNSMDFTDVIKFFNEMAERHDAQSILQLSRSLVLQLQTIIENK